MEINPIDKAHDLMEKLKNYDPSIRTKSDKGYEWLEEETDICIEVLNPDPNASVKDMIIHCEDDGEFTLYFGVHSHFYPYEHEYESMCELALGILNNEYCAENVFCGEEKKWMLGGFDTREELESPIWEDLDRLLEDKDYKYIAEKIKANGGEVHYFFWDSTYNKIIKIDKEIQK